MANGFVHKSLETRYGFNLVRALVFRRTHGKHKKGSVTNRTCVIFAIFLALKNSNFMYGYCLSLLSSFLPCAVHCSSLKPLLNPQTVPEFPRV